MGSEVASLRAQPPPALTAQHPLRPEGSSGTRPDAVQSHLLPLSILGRPLCQGLGPGPRRLSGACRDCWVPMAGEDKGPREGSACSSHTAGSPPAPIARTRQPAGASLSDPGAAHKGKKALREASSGSLRCRPCGAKEQGGRAGPRSLAQALGGRAGRWTRVLASALGRPELEFLLGTLSLSGSSSIKRVSSGTKPHGPCEG